MRHGYYYTKIDEDAQAAYDQLLDGFRRFDEKIVLDHVSENSYLAARGAVLPDHPELFWVRNASQYTRNSRGNVETVSVELDGSEPSKVLQLDEIGKEIVLRVKDSSQYGTVKHLLEEIVHSTTYESDSGAADDLQTIPSVLLSHRSVCAGYSAAMKYLCDYAGIGCIQVCGKAGGDMHAWNMVRIDGKYYWLDATWADPMIEGKEDADLINYGWLCPLDDDMKHTHEINLHAWFQESLGISVKYPDASDDLEYYHLNSACMESSDKAQLSDFIEKNLANGQNAVSVKFERKEDMQKADADLEADGRKALNEIIQKVHPDVQKIHTALSMDEKLNVLTVECSCE